jgi:putative endonuclease
MMEIIYTAYVLYSPTFDKTYTGFTADLIDRFHSHNSLTTKGWAIHYRPWMVAYCEWYVDKKIAIKREKFLKSGQGRAFIQNYLNKHFRS